MKRYGFTGTRHGMTIAQHCTLARIMLCAHKSDDQIWWHHGICVGADEESHKLARVFDFKIKGHPPRSRRYLADILWAEFDSLAQAEGYIERNHAIVDETSSLIATPYTDNEVQRSGTWATVRYAVGRGHDVTIIYPDGKTEKR